MSKKRINLLTAVNSVSISKTGDTYRWRSMR